MNKNILVTGGCGFIGSHFIRSLLNTGNEWKIFNLDCLSYAADVKRIDDVSKDEQYCFIEGDVRNREDIEKVFSFGVDIVVHFSAESHVDRSILNPLLFEEVNVKGTLNLLEASRKHKVEKFVHISTDEVYGTIENGKFTEESPVTPNSPYSVSKAAADLFVRSYIKTYSFPAIIVRPSNNYGPWQYPEKLIPVVIYKAINNEKIPVYGKGLNRREWLYVDDCVQGIRFIMDKGNIGEIYNLGVNAEYQNLELVKFIVRELKRSESLIQFVKDRPGHDYRYSLDSSKLYKLGWEPQNDFHESMTNTLNWYKQNLDWVESKVKYLKDYWKQIYMGEINA